MTTMNPQAFISLFREAFGEKPSLPLAFWYADRPVAETPKTCGCFFSRLKDAREGTPVAFSVDNTTCGGGKFYSGFTAMPEHVPNFVSNVERYKKTPEMVIDYVKNTDIRLSPEPYLNFARVDRIDSFDTMEGLVFFATPDMLAGLCTWAYFDNNAEDAVSAQFGSGCASVVSMALKENRLGGKRTFLGGFDPSVRLQLGSDELTFVIPRSRWETMQETMQHCCLFNTKAWAKVRGRINE